MRRRPAARGAARRHRADHGRRPHGADRRRRAGGRRPDRRGRRRPRRCPRAPQEIDATGGIVMPGMIDTHRHMWQTAMRGYGADWTLTQYFVWYYLEHGKPFRPEDIYAGNLLAAWEALDAGVTTTVDWSHGLQTVDHAEAAVDALQAVPGRFVLAYGNIQAGPWEWTADPAVQRRSSSAAARRRRPARRPAGLRRHRRPGVPGEGGLRGGPRARPAGDHPRRRVGRHQRRRHPADARERLHDPGDRLRARRHAERRLLPADRRHRRLGLGRRPSPSRAPARATRPPGRCAATTSRCRCRWTPACGGAATCSRAMRTTLGADRSREHLEAHAKGDTVTHVPPARRAGRRLGDPRRRPGARARRPRQPRAGQEGRRRADQERRLAGARSRCSTRTGTSRSRPSAATCTP